MRKVRLAGFRQRQRNWKWSERHREWDWEGERMRQREGEMGRIHNEEKRGEVCWWLLPPLPPSSSFYSSFPLLPYPLPPPSISSKHTLTHSCFMHCWRQFLMHEMANSCKGYSRSHRHPHTAIKGLIANSFSTQDASVEMSLSRKCRVLNSQL